MKILTAKDAKYGVERLVDLARAEPIAVVEEYAPLKAVEVDAAPKALIGTSREE